MDRRFTGRDLFGDGEWEFGTSPDWITYFFIVVPHLPPQDKARLSRELLEIVGNRSESLSAKIKAAAVIVFHGDNLGLRESPTMARALTRIFEAEFLGGRSARNRPLAQAAILGANSHGRQYTFLLMLLAAVMMAHLKKGRLLGLRVAKLAAGTSLGSSLSRTLLANKRPIRPKPPRRRNH